MSSALLNNRVAVVCGASRGIGRAIAEAFAHAGARVCLVARDGETVERTAREIAEAAGSEVCAIAADLGAPEVPAMLVKAMQARWGSVHIVVNNAGGPPSGSFLEHDDATWEAAIHRNLLSVVRMARAVSPLMQAQQWGRIISISSTVAKEPTPTMVLSATARAGVSTFTKAIASELAPFKITANVILPGGVHTERLDSLVRVRAERIGRPHDALLAEQVASIPVGRFAAPEEIANVALFLASEQSSYVTGTSIVVDGALTKGVY